MATPPRIALFVGFDARIAGGLITMAAMMRGGLDASGAQVDLFMPAMVAGERLVRGVHRVACGPDTWLAAPTVPRLPNLLAPLLPSLSLARALRSYDLVQSVVGGGAWALPALGGQRSVAWVATPTEVELRSRFHAHNALQALALDGWMRAENLVEGAVLKRQDHVLALSQKTADVLVQLHSIPSERLSRLYPWIDPSRFFPPATPTDAPVCVTSCRLDDARKDVPALIRAFRRVVDELPAARLVLIGSSDDDGPVRREIAATALGGSVELTGWLSADEIGARLRGASVFALSSRQEGLGIVALEAMACGLPVVCFPNGGTDELVERSRAGVLVSGRSEEALASALLRLFASRDERRHMAEAATRFVAAEASKAAFVARLGEVYARLGVPLAT